VKQILEGFFLRLNSISFVGISSSSSSSSSLPYSWFISREIVPRSLFIAAATALAAWERLLEGFSETLEEKELSI